ncbi:MAG: hypothetical protein AAF581_17995 [Planctomycetota bacterium]
MRSLLCVALVAMAIFTHTGMTMAQPNDNCGGAAVISLGVTPFDNTSSSFLGADLSGGACSLPGDSVFDNDLYYCYTAGSGGTIEVQFTKLTDTGLPIPFEPRMAVLSGCGCPATPANVIACTEGNPSMSLQFTAVAGNSYTLVIGSFFAFGTGTGNITLTAGLPPVENLSCDDTATGADMNWSLPIFVPGPSYDGGINIYVDGTLHTNIPGTSTSYTYTAPAMFAGPVNLCAEGVSTTLGAAPQTCCSVVIGGPANDDCSSAIAVGLGATAFDSFLGTQDGPVLSGCIANATPDVWFRFTPPGTALYDVSLCNGTTFDSVVAVYADNGSCPPLQSDEVACDVDSCGQQSVVTTTLMAGTDYFIRVAGENGQSGPGVLTIQTPCGPLSGLMCSYDCTTETVSLSWTNGDVYTDLSVLRNGTTIGAALPVTSTTFQDPTPPNGLVTYQIAAQCGTSIVTTECTIEVLSPTDVYTDLILSLETQTLTIPGQVESVAALEPALLANGRTPAVLRTQFLDYPCLAAIIAQVDVVWTLTGTFPFDYRISSVEGDELAGYGAMGKGLYFEGSDHWAFNHTISLLDDRDGIDAGSSGNGDGSFDLMDGADGTTGPALSGFAAIGYTPDSLTGMDSTDQLSPLLTVDLVELNTVWTNSDNSPGLTEGAYATGVSTVHNDAGRMIAKSWEFGGYTGDQTALAAAYLAFLSTAMPGQGFNRGDCNVDGTANIADAVTLLTALFPPAGCTPGVDCPEVDCVDACDNNDDGAFNIADAVALLSVLFPQGCVPGVDCPTIPAPSGCGVDPTDTDSLDCDSFSLCP